MATEVARAMRDDGRPSSTINIALITGIRGLNAAAPYGVSKAGVIHLTKQMAAEFARYRIRVNALAPGSFATDLNRDDLDSAGGAALLKRMPVRRFGDYEEPDGPAVAVRRLTCSPEFMPLVS